jgi:hypothetical protein
MAPLQSHVAAELDLIQRKLAYLAENERTTNAIAAYAAVNIALEALRRAEGDIVADPEATCQTCGHWVWRGGCCKEI